MSGEYKPEVVKISRGGIPDRLVTKLSGGKYGVETLTVKMLVPHEFNLLRIPDFIEGNFQAVYPNIRVLIKTGQKSD